jgi:GDP-L-fucose synthase
MKILLTGGSGFIGRNIIESLKNKYDLFYPKRNELNLLDENEVKNFIKKNKIDIIIHSAMKPGHRNAADPNNILEENLRMFFNIARNNEFFDKMIFLSSGAVYNTNQDLKKVEESFFDKSIPKDPNGFYKYICTKYLLEKNNIYDLRLFGVFGKYEDYSIRFISNAICKTLHNLPITIKKDRVFDYLFIDDFIDILIYWIENKNNLQYKSYNITPTKSINLSSLALIIKEKNEIQIGDFGLGFEYSGSNFRLLNELSFNFTSYENSIENLKKWYKDNLNTINKDFLLYDK